MNKSDVMSDITQNQYDWTLRLAKDFKNTHEILMGIAETARKLDYFTPAMRRVVKANSNATVPLDTATEYFILKYLENLFSNFFPK